MICKRLFPLLSLTLMLFAFNYSFAGLSFANRNSTIRASGTSTFVTYQNITGYDGTLARASGATIDESGTKTITFDDGVLECSKADASGGVSEVLMTGVYTPNTIGSDTISLGAGNRMRAESGTIIQTISVAETNAWLEGQPIFEDDPGITFDGAYILNMAIQNKLNKDINLNGGTLKLQDDLCMADGVNIRGAGTIDVNHKTLELGKATRNYNSAITWQNAGDVVLTSSLTLEAAWTFDSDGTLDGDGHVLDLASGGKIKVTNDSTLLLKNVTIRNIGGLASSGNIELSSAAVLQLQDVTWAQTGDYTFDQGTFTVMKGAEFKIVVDGDDADDAVEFKYTSNADSTIDTNATMYLDYRVTFNYNVNGDATRLVFTNRSSRLYMHGAILYCGDENDGFELTKGTLVVDHDCQLGSNSTTEDKGIMIGDDTAVNNFYVEVLPAAVLDISSGRVDYHNTI